MTNAEVARIFREMARLLEVEGANPFRVRAYERAAQNIEALGGDIAEWVARDRLGEIPGIGKDLAAKITEIVVTGRLFGLEELKTRVPAGLLEILEVPGLGPKRARLIYESLGVENLDELEVAARSGKIRTLPGIRAKTEESILKGIALLRGGAGRPPLGIVLPVARRLMELLKARAPVAQVAIAGSLRRYRETVKDIDLLATSEDVRSVMSAFVGLPMVTEVMLSGPTKTSVRLEDGLQVDLRLVEPSSFGAALCYFTGSKAHNVRVRETGVQQGLKINEYGVFRREELLAGETEEEVYQAVGLPWIAPELREDRGEIEAAWAGRLPYLVKADELLGDGHVHSSYSDGAASLVQIADAARAHGYGWVIVCDHSRSLRVAGGLDERALMEKKEAIDRINARLAPRGPRLLCGAEVDILSDGTLDYPDEVLRQLDWVVAAIHSGFKQDEAQITDRLLAAVRSPWVHCIAHPTGRLLGEREPYALDVERVFTAAAETKTALEINAFFRRLDLNDVLARRAREKGCRLMIGTDAHTLDQLDQMELGLGVARRAWLEPKDLLNTLHLNELQAMVRRKSGVVGLS